MHWWLATRATEMRMCGCLQDDEEKEMLERELVIGHLRNKLGK